ncbi:MAG: response regulator transcription factor [Planctomycetota bacterium]
MAREHILVVEDEQHLAVGIKFNLEAEGYRVTYVSDGASALNIIHQTPEEISLLILDLMLPGMSGYAVCETLRERGWDKPILMLSARTLPEDLKQGFDVGTNQYMTKPFDLEELISRIRNLLTHYPPRPASAANVQSREVGEVKINFATFEVFKSGEPIRMTQLEMKLLQYFVRNEGRVIPRQELLRQVWGVPGHVRTRAPDQFIRRLRKVFEPDPANPIHFLTIRDAGYRFVAEPSDSTG